MNTTWAADALCNQTDPEAFFPSDNANPRPAQRVCAACPVRTDCLEDALAREEPWGVWGGHTPIQRRRLLAARRRTQQHDTSAA